MIPLAPRRRSSVGAAGEAPVVVYDSGVGGLTVARHLARLRPHTNLVYVADNAWFPYGDKSAPALRARVFSVLESVMTTLEPAAVVVACNTASTAAGTALEALTGGVPLFLVTPPIRRTVTVVGDAPIALLATSATVRTVSVRRQITEYAPDGQIWLVPTMGLVHLAERKLAGGRVVAADIADELDPILRPEHRARVNGVILGCTHFPWLLEELRPAFPHAFHWADPALDAARRVDELLPAGEPTAPPGNRTLWLTGPRDRTRCVSVFSRHGFTSDFARPRDHAA